MATKFKLETFTTPPGIARLAFITKPSTTFNPDGTYSVKIVFDPDEVSDLIARFEQEIEKKVEETIRENPKVKKVIKKVQPFAQDLDDEGDETGKIILNFKRNAKQKLRDGTVKTNKVKVVDTTGNIVKDEVWSGSTVAARFFISPYFSEKDKEVGVSLKLTHVQVIDLVNGGSRDGPEDVERLGFVKRDGFVASKPTKSGVSDEDAGVSEDEGDADF